MYYVETSKSAAQDMREAVAYIAGKLHNLPAANRLHDEADKAIFSLEEMPHRHPIVQDKHLASLGFRFFPVRNYLVFYIVREESKTVVIERFLYGKSDWASILKGDEISENT